MRVLWQSMVAWQAATHPLVVPISRFTGSFTVRTGSMDENRKYLAHATHSAAHIP